jgi:hypothetical protein
MNKLISVAALTLAAITPAWSNEAADLLVKACLPAMDDLANVDAIGRENDWTRLRPPVSDQYTRSAWGTNGYTVIARSHFAPSCHLIIRPSKMVDRNDLFAAISASLQLKPSPEQTYRGKFRREIWEIVNSRPLKLLITSNDDMVSVATIYLADAAPGIPRYFFGIACP